MENHKFKKKKKEIGVKARLIPGEPNLVSSENQNAFRKRCFKFSTTTKYLYEHLLLNVSVIRNIQFLHPEKRNNSGATNAI